MEIADIEDAELPGKGRVSGEVRLFYSQSLKVSVRI